ncbi:MAG: sigma-54 dependent transcriptional regulator [Chloroflexota bacterium]|nr:sigma-54 dependent transcriptional regulator [Chloroflexota bacterium]
MTRRLLIVDDDPAIRETLGEVLAGDGTEVAVAESAEAALVRIAHDGAEVILSDVRMSGLDGVELLRLLRERGCDADVILMTAFDDMPTVVAAMREGAAEFLVKPLDLHDLRRVIDVVFEDRKARSRAGKREGAPTSRPTQPNPLVGRDPGMVAVYKLVGQASASRATVLIRGETGTGKELIARAVHSNSREAEAPFVAVNCAALPASLLESELFGHVRGSFTGASADRRGRFSLAGRGTIFLDEIGDTTLDLQAKLLRILQEREFYPVGAERPQKTEARVIAATHRDLEEMVSRGEFRADLYYRLRVIEISVPPLRDRAADIEQLAEHLVRRASASTGKPTPLISRDAIDALKRHQWPGNVRELENCLTRATLLASGEVIRAEHVQIGPAFDDNAVPLVTLESLEKTHVERVLASTGGHKTRAAQILGISRPRLDRVLKKHGLD